MSSSSLSPIEMVVSPRWIFAVLPSSSALFPKDNAGQRNRRTTPSRIEPSISALGGVKNQPSISPMTIVSVLQNAIMYCFLAVKIRFPIS